MTGRRFGTMALAAIALVALMAGSAFAQAQGGGGQGGGGRGNRGNRGGNFDPAQFRQRMMDRLKQDLGANDDEWKVLQPKVEKVMEAQRAARDTGRFGGFGGRGGRGGPGGGGPGGGGPGAAAPNANQPQSDLAKAAQELRTVLDDKNSTAEQITQKLAALRQAREKAHTELAAAQKELKELLTARQEATLVSNGTLE